MTIEAPQKKKTSTWRATFYWGNGIGFLVALLNGWLGSLFSHFLASILWTLGSIIFFGFLVQSIWLTVRTLKNAYEFFIVSHTVNNAISQGKIQQTADFDTALSTIRNQRLVASISGLTALLAIISGIIQVRTTHMEQPSYWGWIAMSSIIATYGMIAFGLSLNIKIAKILTPIFDSLPRSESADESSPSRAQDESSNSEELFQLTEHEKAVLFPSEPPALPIPREQLARPKLPQRPASPFPKTQKPAFNDSDDINLG